MGQKIVSGLTQRAVARFIREVLLQDSDQDLLQNGSYPPPLPKLALPPAAN
jgi:hypothetical protein